MFWFLGRILFFFENKFWIELFYKSNNIVKQNCWSVNHISESIYFNYFSFAFTFQVFPIWMINYMVSQLILSLLWLFVLCRTGGSKLWFVWQIGHCLFLWIRFDWNAATTTYFCIVCGYFHTTIAEFAVVIKTNRLQSKNIYYFDIYRKILLTLI